MVSFLAFFWGDTLTSSTIGGWGHIQNKIHIHFRIWVILIGEDPTVTVKCRTAIKVMCLYLILCLSVMLDHLSCSFTSISFLTNKFSLPYQRQCELLPSLAVCHPLLTFHILIFSETSWQNELKLGKKNLIKSAHFIQLC